jgi:Cu-Zn family superoxide dismutase
MILRRVLVGAAALLLAGMAFAAEKPRKEAKAEIKDAKGQVVGKATFKETKTGVNVVASFSNLPQGVHAFHVHDVGKCEAPDFKSAGPHFNPEHKQHGLMNMQGHHAGDMQNLKVAAQGTAKYKATLDGVTLTGDGEKSLFHKGGTAVVVHEKADDMKSDPAGNAGARIACGPIQ